MRIRFERKGGFAGIPLVSTIDLEELPTPEGEALRGLIDGADFFSLPAEIRALKPVPDTFQYKITVETPDQQRVISVDETAASPPLRALLQALSSIAQRHRKA